ncbi:sugar ABC transporter permease [Nonomuraea sp. LP-02]|uniref:carbohydrate ABC transporter permease n=1 Tax=Nonomuraea sp. LP-02 TaxID=3097960 RepID=UPI002E366479|nr:sugar ABC transporter permease [Nonomuraea sp. LP-02]MED7931919.1 sugar ABC transporter permease [Nonomuraea sp. LP-02]
MVTETRPPGTSSGPEPVTASRPSRSPLRSAQRRAGWILVLPAALALSLVTIVPIGYGFYLSLTSYNPVERGGPRFHGLDGYLAVLQSGEFWHAIWITVQYAFGTLILAVPAALALALLVNGRFPGVALFRAVLYLPRVVPLVAVSMIWLWLYSHDGLFNYLLDLVGLPPVDFLTDEDTALLSLIGMRAWKALGGSMIIFLAGLQAVPASLLEAAAVDGCGRWRTLRHVILPLLVPITTYVVVVDLIYLAQSFSEIYVLTSGGPLSSTTVLNMLIYNEAFEHYRLGNASAMAFLLFCLIFGLAYLSIRSMARGGRR